MNSVLDLQQQILALPPVDRERLAALTWASLAEDPSIAACPDIDPEGIELASQRDADIESGAARPIDHSEFLRRTGGKIE
jgi:hypothetical protein